MAGPLIILSGPSGSGKSTLIQRLRATSPELPLRQSVSATTRPPRPGEQNGVHYHFWDRQRFEEERQAGGFLEWAEVHGNFYGTLRRQVEEYRQQGIGVILAIDVQGAEQVRQQCPDAVLVFLRPSSLATCKQRLRDRGESEATVRKRMAGAQHELARESAYHDTVINDDLDKAVADFRAILQRLFERCNDHAG